MKYDITKPQAPPMPKLKKGTECIKNLLTQVSKDMREPIPPMLFPILGAHMSNSQILYPDPSWKEPTGMMANLVAESGGNKGQLSNLVEAICRIFRKHDDEGKTGNPLLRVNFTISSTPHSSRQFYMNDLKTGIMIPSIIPPTFLRVFSHIPPSQLRQIGPEKWRTSKTFNPLK